MLEELSDHGSRRPDLFLIYSQNEIMCHTNISLHGRKIEDLQGNPIPEIPMLSQGMSYHISSMNNLNDFNRYLRFEKKNCDFRESRKLFNIGSEKLSS